MALDVADYAYVMETGGIILQGPSADLRQDEKVAKAYLGG
jgi:branched-chain amino acid transport system ATP-binding protein